MESTEPPVTDADEVEDVGYYFKYLGGLQFARDEEEILSAPGSARLLAVSNTYGVTAVSVLSEVYIVQTKELIQRASAKAGSDQYPAQDPHSFSLCSFSCEQEVAQLDLSSDELALACVTGESVAFYSVPDLANQRTTAPIHSISIDSGIKLFKWRKDSHSGRPDQFLLLSQDNRLFVGSCGDPGLTDVAPHVEVADWAPDSGSLLYSLGRRLHFWSYSLGKDVCSLQVTHPSVDASQLVVESLAWVQPHRVLLSCSVVEEDEEQGDAFVMALAWEGGAVEAGQAPQDLSIYALTPAYIEESSTPPLSGPYLHVAGLPAWQAVVAMHRKRNDDHLQLLELAPTVSSVMVTDDKTGLRLPNTPNGDDNFVLGLGLDLTYDTGRIPHPLSLEQGDLPPTPVLLVMTCDAILRFYCFGHMGRQEVLSRPAQALPLEAPAWLHDLTSATSEAPGASGVLEDSTKAAVAAALPDSDEDEEEEEEEEEEEVQGASTAFGQQQHGAADTLRVEALGIPRPQRSHATEATSEGQDSETNSTATSPSFLRLQGPGAGLAVGAKAMVQEVAEADGEGSAAKGGLDPQRAARVGLPDSDESDLNESSSESGEESGEEEVSSPGMPSAGQPKVLPFTLPSTSAPTSSAQSTATQAPPAAPAFPSLTGFGAAPSLPGVVSSGVPSSSLFGGGAFNFQSGMGAGSSLSPTPPAVTTGVTSGGLFGSFSLTQPASAAASASSAAAPAAASAAAPITTPPASKLSFGSLAVTAPAGGLGATSAPAFGAVTTSAPMFGAPAAGGLFGGAALSLPPAASAPAAGFSLFAPPIKPVPKETDDFKPAPRFSGAMPGFVFSTREGVTGYYRDLRPAVQAEAPAESKAPASTAPAPAAAPAPVPAPAFAPAPAAKVAKAAPAAAVAQPPAAPAAVAKPPAPAAKPAKKALPEVPAPQPKLAGESPEVASAEADFLRSLHQVQRLAAELQAGMAELEGGEGPASKRAYGPVAQGIQELLKQARGMAKEHDEANKDLALLVDGLEDVDRVRLALQLFQQGADVAAVQRKLPLEPALAQLRSSLDGQVEGLARCLQDLEAQLEQWEEQQRAGARGLGGRPAPTLVYSTLNLQADTLRNLLARIHDLGQAMGERGLGGKDLSSSAKALAAWARGAKAEEEGGAAWRPIALRTPASTKSKGDGRPDWQTPRSSGRGKLASPSSPFVAGGSPWASLSPAQSAWTSTVPKLVQVTRTAGRVRTTRAPRTRATDWSDSDDEEQRQQQAAQELAALRSSSPVGSPVRIEKAVSAATGANKAAKGARSGPGSAAFTFSPLPTAPAPAAVPPAASSPFGSTFSLAPLSFPPAQLAAPTTATAAATVPRAPAAGLATFGAPLTKPVENSSTAAAAAAPAPAKPKAKSSQPPMPSFAQMQAAQALSANVLGKKPAPASGPAAPAPFSTITSVVPAAPAPAAPAPFSTITTVVPAASAPAAPAPPAAPAAVAAAAAAPPAASKPSAKRSSQPPMPSMDAMLAAQRLGQQVLGSQASVGSSGLQVLASQASAEPAPTSSQQSNANSFVGAPDGAKAAQQAAAAAAEARAAVGGSGELPSPTNSTGSSTVSGATSKPPSKPKSSQPPIPSMEALMAAQKLGAQTLGAAGAKPQAPKEEKPSQSAAAPAAPAAPTGGFLSGLSLGGQPAEAGKAPAAPMFNFASFGSQPSSAPAASQSGAAAPAAAATSTFGAFNFGSAATPTTTTATTAASSAAASGAASAPALAPAAAATASGGAPATSSLFGAFGAAPGSAAASAPAAAAAAAPSLFSSLQLGSSTPASTSAAAPAASAPAAFAAPAAASAASAPAAPAANAFGQPPAAPAAGSVGGLFSSFSLSTTPPSPGGPASPPTTSSGGLFGGAASATTAPAFGQPANLGGGLGGLNLGSPSTGFSLFGSNNAASKPAGTLGFGSPATPGGAAPAAPALGSPATPASTGGAPFGTPATLGAAPGASPFGTPTPNPAASPFGAAAAASPNPAASPFGSFGAAASAPAAGGGGLFSGFGQPSSLGSPATPGFGQPAGFGVPSAMGGFGQPAAPAAPAFGSSGFGQPPALPQGTFGQAASPGGAFGAMGGFGQPAAPAAPAAPAGGGFAAFAQQGTGGGGGFAALASQAGGGFGALAGQASPFGSLGGGGGAFGGAAQQPAAGGSSLWQMRR